MLIDINTYVGHWPFRKVGNGTADELIKVMDDSGIDMAAVSSINAIFYKDSQQGNDELIGQIDRYKERFIPFAIINPSYTGWKKDFEDCIGKMGMKGLELYPYYHQYRLTDSNAVELVRMAAERSIAVHLPCSVVNIRQRHWLDTTENLSVQEVEEVVRLCPDTDFIITNGPVLRMAGCLEKAAGSRKGRIYYDFARVDIFSTDFTALIESVGADRVVFGSVAPMQYIAPQLVKLHYSGLNDIEQEKVMSGNLKQLFGLCCGRSSH